MRDVYWLDAKIKYELKQRKQILMKIEIKNFISTFLIIFFTAELTMHAQSLCKELKIFEPLINKEWNGELKSPDGTASWKTTHIFTLLWDGTIIKFTGRTPDRNSNSEGYIYWDRGVQKIAVLIVHNKGIYQRGLVEAENGKIIIKGTISFPERTFDFKNTLEITADGKLIDRWFQNAFGDWRPGHVIEFKTKL